MNIAKEVNNIESMISIIIPLYNEEESIRLIYDEIKKDIKDHKYQILFIDDGSTDGSLTIIKEILEKDENINIYSFRKNLGKAEALTFGFQKAKGDIIVTLDADLQDKPSEIPKILEKLKEGWDVVCGWRKDRKDPWKKVMSSRIFNYLAGILWGFKLHDFNCGLKAYKKEAAKSLNLYGGMHRFIPLIVHQQGFSVTEVPVVHEKRKYGKSKYGFSKVVKDLPDMFTVFFLTRYSNRPLHFFGLMGGILLMIGIAILGYLSILRLEGETIGRRPLLFFGMLLVLSGLQVFFTGFLADLMINLSQNKRIEPLLKYSSDK